MALIQKTGGNQNNAVQYSLRKLPNGSRVFAVECAADAPGAVELVRSKDSPSGKFVSGDKFHVQTGDTLVGKLGGMWVKQGFGGGVSREVSILLTSNDTEGAKVAEFLQLRLLDDKGRVDRETASLLARLKNVKRDEDVSLSVFTFAHKAGDPIDKNRPEAGNWDKAGSTMALAMYQESLKSEANPKGTVKAAADEYYRQPTFYISGTSVIHIKQGEKAPDNVVVNYDAQDAISFAEGIAAAVTPVAEQAEQNEQSAAAPAA